MKGLSVIAGLKKEGHISIPAGIPQEGAVEM